jgi:hypothetical protein
LPRRALQGGSDSTEGPLRIVVQGKCHECPPLHDLRSPIATLQSPEPDAELAARPTQLSLDVEDFC